MKSGSSSAQYQESFVFCSMSKSNDKGKEKGNVIPPKPQPETRLMVNVATANNCKGKFSEVTREDGRNKKN